MPCTLTEADVVFVPIREQGPGGQNVNKVSCAVHLRFDVRQSSLPEALKARLLAWPDQRISKDGIVVIKAQAARSLPLNKADALTRLNQLIAQASEVQLVRRATKPTWGSKQRRLEGKAVRSHLKATRGKLRD